MRTHPTSPLHRALACMVAVALATGMLPPRAMANSIVAAAADPTSSAVTATNESLSIDGGITVSDSTFAAKVAGQGEGGKATLTIGGDVQNNTSVHKNEFGVVAYGFNGGMGSVTVGGGVTTAPSEGSVNPKAVGVFCNMDAGTTAVDVAGNVTATSTGDTGGIWLEGAADSKSTVKVGGNVTATSTCADDSEYDAFAIYAQAGNSGGEADAPADATSLLVEVEGGVFASAEGSPNATGCGAYLYSAGGSTSETVVHGNIQATGVVTGAGAKISAVSNGRSRLVANGDIAATCEKQGAGAWLESTDGGVAELVAQGTVRGTTTGLLFDGMGETRYDVTVWKLEADGSGPLVQKGAYAEGVPDDISSQINYIVKVEQPQTGGTIRAVSQDGGALVRKDDLEVAHVGDKIYLQADLQPGYRLAGAYNGRGERVSLAHDDGGYYVVVPEGGGIYLTADIAPESPKGAATGMNIANGMAQPVFSLSDVRSKGYTNASSEIYRFVTYVETDYDTDRDGSCDLVKTYVQVPRAAVEGGYRAPVVFEADPYGAGIRTWNTFVYGVATTDDKTLMDRPQHRTPTGSITSAELALSPTLTSIDEWNYEIPNVATSLPSNIEDFDYFLARGFAVAQTAGLGTHGSEGVECLGTVMERDALANVVEWLHGTQGRRAYADAAGTIEVKATDWSNGSVAMTGLSYPGALCYEVATSGVEGLQTVVPVAGLASWYDRSNSQGISTEPLTVYNYSTVLADTCASRLFNEPEPSLLDLYQSYRTHMRDSQVALAGDYGPHWRARDFYTGQTGIKASALIVMGLNDTNVHTKQFDLMRNAFLSSGREAKVLLHQSTHETPVNERDGADIMIGDHTYLEWLNLWFSRELLGVQNDASSLPDFTVQSNVDGTFYASDRWNEKDAVTLYPTGEDETTVHAAGAHMSNDELMQDTFTGSASKNAALWTLDARERFTIAGKIAVHVRAKVDDVREGDIPLCAVLLDVASEPFAAFCVNGSIESEVVSKGTADAPLNYDVARWKQTDTTKKVVSTGQMDLRNPEAGYEPATATKRDEPIRANTYYDYTVWLDPTYYTVREGHRLELYLVPFCNYALDTPVAEMEQMQREAVLERHGLDDTSLMHIRTDYSFTIQNAASWATLPVAEKIGYELAASSGSTFAWKRTLNDAETMRHFSGITVDGVTVDKTSYTAKAGSVVVSLTPSYLATLSAGSHSVAAQFDDGTGTPTTFAVDGTAQDATGSTASGGATGGTMASGTAAGGGATSGTTTGGTTVGGATVGNAQTRLGSTKDHTPRVLPAAICGALLICISFILKRRRDRRPTR